MAGVEWIEGGLLAVPGFRAYGDHAGIKPSGRDLAIIASDVPCAAAVVATKNAFRAAPVELSVARARGGRLQAIVLNSGVANAATGPVGMRDAERMAAVAGEALGISPRLVAVASTGAIGRTLPMDKVELGIRRVVGSLGAARGGEAAEAIMTTDTRPKEAALRFTLSGRGVALGAIAKGSGMVAPNMSTMLAFLITDAAVKPSALKRALREATALTFNQLNIDGDTSCNDMAVVLANGLAANRPVALGSRDYRVLRSALEEMCRHLVELMAADGEGATLALRVEVEGASSARVAMAVAKGIAGSLRVKAAAHGADPNWGRVLVAVGITPGSGLDQSRVDVAMGAPSALTEVVRAGKPLEFDRGELSRLLMGPWVIIRVHLHKGKGRGTAWGCDLSPRYVEINADYEGYLRKKAAPA